MSGVVEQLTKSHNFPIKEGQQIFGPGALSIAAPMDLVLSVRFLETEAGEQYVADVPETPWHGSGYPESEAIYECVLDIIRRRHEPFRTTPEQLKMLTPDYWKHNQGMEIAQNVIADNRLAGYFESIMEWAGMLQSEHIDIIHKLEAMIGRREVDENFSSVILRWTSKLGVFQRELAVSRRVYTLPVLTTADPGQWPNIPDIATTPPSFANPVSTRLRQQGYPHPYKPR